MKTSKILFGLVVFGLWCLFFEFVQPNWITYPVIGWLVYSMLRDWAHKQPTILGTLLTGLFVTLVAFKLLKLLPYGVVLIIAAVAVAQVVMGFAKTSHPIKNELRKLFSMRVPSPDTKGAR